MTDSTIPASTSLLQDFVAILSKYVPLPMLVINKEHFILKENHIDVVHVLPEDEDHFLNTLKEKVKDFVGEKMFHRLLAEVYRTIANAQIHR
jgi:hypothetical protein